MATRVTDCKAEVWCEPALGFGGQWGRNLGKNWAGFILWHDTEGTVDLVGTMLAPVLSSCSGQLASDVVNMQCIKEQHA